MSTSQTHPVIEYFANPLKGTFSKTTGASEKDYFSDLCRRLEGFNADVLTLASERISRRATSRSWPFPGRCQEACEEVARERSAAAKRDRRAGKEQYGLPEDAAVRILVAQDAGLAIAAIDGEWQGDLVDFIKRHHRMPDETQIEQLVVGAHARKRRHEQDEETELRAFFGEKWQGKQLPASHPRKIMWNAFEARRDRFAEKISEAVLAADPVEGESYV
ncbi:MULTISPECIES: hypothetical protein [unclassified Pseudovibrio]|uniref:hypothetical protein n=1 Tax=unclassified Pseudovibrio TaxID=2627060 RepID=UPI0007AED5FB|nr:MULTISPECIES: hypothetical protein [unclassified Pseudovibrio]KZL02282.1 hypothetical protein PsW74_01380 [Pseudovibrio sp. W74]KZL08174.1 hypothetical protein PsAD14_03321 [Pseudovibrio sp. Ad14]